jgi:hypothetical protein
MRAGRKRGEEHAWHSSFVETQFQESQRVRELLSPHQPVPRRPSRSWFGRLLRAVWRAL